MIDKFFKFNLHILLLYVLLAFPMFYFVYKFGILLEGYADAKSYLELFNNLASKEVPSPFNMRLLSAVCIHFIEKTSILYNTECAIDAFTGVSKHFFFSNVLFNFVCVSLTGFSLYLIFIKLHFPKLLSFLAGVLYLLGFGTIFYLMMPGVDSLSVLIFTWLLYYYIKKSYWIIPLFGLLILQREYYFLVFMVIAFMDFFKEGKNRYCLSVLIISIISFGIYFVLRKTIFYTAHWNHQTSPGFLLNSLFSLKISLLPMIKQTFMTMNVYFIYLLILAYKKHKGLEINKYHFFVTIVLIFQITVLSFAATFGNNNGRYFFLNIPLILYYLLLETRPLFKLESLPESAAINRIN
jgi:hypothetical protein